MSQHIGLSEKGEEDVADPGVQIVREWLRRQPFSLRLLTLLLFMVEAVEEEFGEETKKRFEDDIREAFRKLPFPQDGAN
jgi:hypothetical protein